jgi:DNA-binding transcriptional ArsR family regulator
MGTFRRASKSWGLRACQLWYNENVSRAIGSLDPDIASAAALIGDSSRALILSVLADGRALPAGELARIARISPQTASSHLDKLFKGNLVSVEVQGRHHYYRLRDSDVAELLESLSVVARPTAPLTSVQRERAEQLRFARTCYGHHLAGRLGVATTRALCTNKYLCDEGLGYKVSAAGTAWFRALGIEIGLIKRQPLTKRCLDWSERRYHLAGALGVALAHRILELHWIVRARDSRALRLTDRGKTALRSELGLEI